MRQKQVTVSVSIDTLSFEPLTFIRTVYLIRAVDSSPAPDDAGLFDPHGPWTVRT
jgi:hypothetical protein